MNANIDNFTKPTLLLLLPGLAVLLCSSPARAQLIDDAAQANLMHQHLLMRNQGTGDGQDWADREKLRQKNGGKVMRQDSAQGELSSADRHAFEHQARQGMEARRARLRPEYERRVRTDGQASAAAWLRAEVARLGREDGMALRRSAGPGGR